MAADDSTQQRLWDTGPVLYRCSKCKIRKSLEEFGFQLDKKYGKQRRLVRCKACNLQKLREFHQKNPGRRKETNRIAKLREYGLTEQGYQKMLEAQRFLCAICQNKETMIIKGCIQLLSVDHDHSTGVVRDLLCHRCNKAIGLMREDVAILRAAADYLERHKAKDIPGEL